MMKIFLWEDVMIGDRTEYGSFLVAIAPTVEEARAVLLKKCNYLPESSMSENPKELDLSESIGFVSW